MSRPSIGITTAVIFLWIFGSAAAAATTCPWQSVRMAGLPAPGVALAVSAESATDVWAVGYYLHTSGFQHSFAERFDGTSWTAIATPGIQLNAVRAFSKNDAWALGERSDQGFVFTLATHWDGVAWTAVPTPNGSNNTNELNAIAGLASNDLWAVGSYFNPNNHATLSLAAHWDGNTWTLVPTQNVDLQTILLGAYAAGPNNVWAVGYHDNTGGTDGDPLIEHWNGTRWATVPIQGLPAGQFAGLAAVAGTSASDIWAVGSIFTPPSGASATLTVHFDGTQWRYVPSPNVGHRSNRLTGVAVDENGRAISVGSSGFGTAVLVERWNGNAWSVDRSALSPYYSQLNGVSMDLHDDVWAVGYAGKRPYDEFSCSL